MVVILIEKILYELLWFFYVLYNHVFKINHCFLKFNKFVSSKKKCSFFYILLLFSRAMLCPKLFFYLLLFTVNIDDSIFMIWYNHNFILWQNTKYSHSIQLNDAYYCINMVLWNANQYCIKPNTTSHSVIWNDLFIAYTIKQSLTNWYHIVI